MPNTTVAGPIRRARLPGDGQAPGARASERPPAAPLLDPLDATPIAPRKRAPARVSAGPASPAARAPAPAPEPAARRRYPMAPAPEPLAAPATAAPELAMAASIAPPPAEPAPADTQAPPPAATAKAAGPKTAKKPPGASAEAPPARSGGQALAARNALVGLCLAYMDRLSAQVGSPLRFALNHWALLLIAGAHLALPVALCWLAAHSSPQAAELFLSGGLLANSGKLLWLYLGCAFVWSLAYIGAARLARAAWGDLNRFERLGRSLFGPHSKH